MNPKIKTLAQQAGMVMYPTGLGIQENTLWGDRNIEKFADLIIDECINRINHQYKPVMEKGRMNSGWDKGYVDCGIDSVIAIKEYFRKNHE